MTSSPPAPDLSDGPLLRLKHSQLIPAPWQPRRHFARDALLSLARSIRLEGIQQNLVVRPHPTESGKYEIVAGERRWRACDPALPDQLDLSAEERSTLGERPPSRLPCRVLPLDDWEARRLSAVENLQRVDLDPVEEAAYRLLLIQDVLGLPVYVDEPLGERWTRVSRHLYGMRQNPEQYGEESQRLQTLFQELGELTWESYVTNHLPLLQLPEALLNLVQEGKLAGRSALLIHRQADPHMREQLMDAALGGASLATLTDLVAQLQGKAWKTLASNVRRQLGVRNLSRLDEAQRQRVMELLKALSNALQPA